MIGKLRYRLNLWKPRKAVVRGDLRFTGNDWLILNYHGVVKSNHLRYNGRFVLKEMVRDHREFFNLRTPRLAARPSHIAGCLQFDERLEISRVRMNYAEYDTFL